jgi:hypothetical protein
VTFHKRVIFIDVTVTTDRTSHIKFYSWIYEFAALPVLKNINISESGRVSTIGLEDKEVVLTKSTVTVSSPF